MTEKGGLGFPTLMFLDAEGRTLRVHRGPRTPAGFEKTLEEVGDFQELLEKAESGNAKAATTAFIRQLGLRWFDHAEATKRAAELTKVSGKEKKQIAQLLIDLEVRERAEAAGYDAEKRLAAGEHFLAMWKDDRVPEGDQLAYVFFSAMAEVAEKREDKRLFKKILAGMEDAIPGDSRYRRAVKALEERLRAM